MRISRRSSERTWPCTSDPQRAHPPGPITVPVGVSGQPAPGGDDGQITQRLSAISPTQPARFRYHRTLQAERARAKSAWAGMGNGSAPNSAALMSLKSGRGSRQCRPSLEMISPVQAPPFASQTQARSFRPLELKKVQGSAWLTEVHLHPLAVTVAGAAVPRAVQPEEDVAAVPHRTAEVRLPVHSTPSPVQLPRLSRTS